jgi:hypothetical protein
MNIILADGVAAMAIVCFDKVQIRKHLLEHVTSSCFGTVQIIHLPRPPVLGQRH